METIQLAHGGGGYLTHELIRTEILSRFGDGPLATLPDGATLANPGGPLIFTTDSFVVQPLFFPGGDIGELAVYGTANDIAVCGGRPLWLSLAMILEEGLPLATLRRILDSVQRAAAHCNIGIVTGDTKVVPRGQCDGLYLNTAGIGVRRPGFQTGADTLRAGDILLVSGTLGDHGAAVLAARGQIPLLNGPRSDTGPVQHLVESIGANAPSIRFMRDPTRGGLAAVLNEMVEGLALGIRLNEDALPLTPEVRAVAELMGLDPLHLPSEGRVVAVCAPESADVILAAWRTLPEGRGACRFGQVTNDAGRVILMTLAGGKRLVDQPRGELLPRIC
jgi:hydrogenase expression/formation protein HypE